MKTITEFFRDESGATAVEYGLILGLIAVGMMAGATQLGSSLDDKMGDMAATMDATADSTPTVTQGGD